MNTVGLILFTFGALITLLNFYLSFIRYPIYLACGGRRETYRWASGVPLLGSLALWLSILLLSSEPLRWSAAVLSLFDTAGIHWFLATLLWHGELGVFLRGRGKS